MTLISDFETFSLEIRFTRIPRLAKPILSQNKEPGQPRGHGATFYSNGVGVGGSRYRDTERRDERDRISDSECKGLEQRQSACSVAGAAVDTQAILISDFVWSRGSPHALCWRRDGRPDHSVTRKCCVTVSAWPLLSHRREAALIYV